MMTETKPVLTAQDRCDRCGAQALTVYTVAGMDLLFCFHHHTELGAALVAKGATLTLNQTHTLFEKEN